MKNVKYIVASAIVASLLIGCGGGSKSNDSKTNTEGSTPTTPTTGAVDCSGSAINIGGDGTTFNRLGTFKSVQTYEECPNMSEESCMVITQENGMIKTITKQISEVDTDTCKLNTINMTATQTSKDMKATLPILEDNRGRYILEAEDCSDIDETEEIISGIPNSVKQNAIRTTKYSSNEGNFNNYLVQENGKYYSYTYATRGSQSQSTKAQCTIGSGVKSYFQNNALIEEDGDITETRIK